MLNREEIFEAVDLHQRSYNLLIWLSTAISKGFIHFDRAHDYLDEAEAAAGWILGHFNNLPPDCRPEQHEQLKPFAQFFATYLTTSFDLAKNPGTRLESWCGCYCSICAQLMTAPHLKTKKVSRHDKQRARKLKIAVVQHIAGELGTCLDQEQAEKLVDSQANATDVATVAYGHQLIERVHGNSKGPAVLALWREIAWEKTGAPKKEFKLDAEDILRAEQALVNTIVDLN
ncbi:MAG TPA: hypothetical protein VFZ71_00335 [Pyrinomonadaceae bacterium]